MSSRTLQILAVVLGVVGILLGALGTITAYNAKKSVRSDSELTSAVQSAFASEQAKQDALEKKQASDAERFVSQLNKGEKSLIRKIHANTGLINARGKEIRSLRRKVRQTSQEVAALTSRDRGLANELASVESSLNTRINRLNRRIDKQQNQISRLRGFVSP